METSTKSYYNESVENDLYKLSVKELKKMARQSNINPNYKKTELVKALLSVTNDVIDNKEVTTEIRMTRSRASVFKPLSIISDNPQDSETHKNKTAKLNSSCTVDGSIPSNSIKQRRKTRVRKEQEEETQDRISYDTSDMFPMVNIISTNTHHPVKLNNKDGFDQIETKSQKKDEARTLKKSKTPKLDSDTKSQLKESISEDNSFSPSISYCNNLGNEKEVLNSSYGTEVQTNERPEEKTGKRGRKRKVEEKSILNASNVKQSDVGKESLSIEEPIHSRLQNGNKSRLEKVDTLFVESNSDQSTKENNQSKENKKLKRGHNSKKITVKNEDINENAQLIAMDISREVQVSCLGETETSTKLENCKRHSYTIQLDTALVECNMYQNKENVNEGTVSVNTDIPAPTKLARSKKSKRGGSQNLSDNEKVQLNEGNISQEMYSKSQGSCYRETASSTNSESCKQRSPQMTKSENLFNSHNNKAINCLDSKAQAENEVSQHNESCKDEAADTMPALLRSSTFTLGDGDGKSPRRGSLRFTPSVTRNTPPASSKKAIEKSIGSRIISSSMKKVVKPPVKKSTGSSVKKTIMKHTTTPGSVFKNKCGNSKKAPDFKAVHQKLFENMESIYDNHNRKMERAQRLLQSPIAPRCAFTSVNKNREQPKFDQGIPCKKATPLKVQSPLVKLPPVSSIKVKTPVCARKPGPPSSTNRFGFRSAINKTEAKDIVGKKLPPVSLEKRKDQERNFIRGVRMNKRFMLQMQMRQNQL